MLCNERGAALVSEVVVEGPHRREPQHVEFRRERIGFSRFPVTAEQHPSPVIRQKSQYVVLECLGEFRVRSARHAVEAESKSVRRDARFQYA
jgi:hypothetical protein